MKSEFNNFKVKTKEENKITTINIYKKRKTKQNKIMKSEFNNFKVKTKEENKATTI